MSDDLLRDASRALRQETADDESGRFTRARVMATLHQSQVRRRTRLAFVLPLAASFAAATAWGTVSGRAPELARSVVRALGFSVETTPRPTPSQRSNPRNTKRSSPPAQPAAPAPAPPPAVENTEPAPPSPQESGARRSSTPPSAGSGSASPAARDPAHELYRAAHRWHFAEQNCARAIDAWAAYLAAAPRGRFAPEARYNHALCLIRLGRYEQARSALAPFAHGHFGTYRQRDAQELLNALGRPD